MKIQIREAGVVLKKVENRQWGGQYECWRVREEIPKEELEALLRDKMFFKEEKSSSDFYDYWHSEVVTAEPLEGEWLKVKTSEFSGSNGRTSHSSSSETIFILLSIEGRVRVVTNTDGASGSIAVGQCSRCGYTVNQTHLSEKSKKVEEWLIKGQEKTLLFENYEPSPADNAWSEDYGLCSKCEQEESAKEIIAGS